MKTIVKYRLSEAGRKAALLAGLPADAVQNAEVGAGAPEFAAVVAAGTISGDTLVLDTTQSIGGCGPGYVPATEWDLVPSIQEVLDDEVARRAKSAAQVEAAAAAAREKTIAVLTERRTRERANSIGYGSTSASYVERFADWPYDAAKEIVESELAKAWVAELDAANAAAKAAAEAIKAGKEAEAAAKKAEAEQAEVQRRASLGLQDGEFDYAVENGCLMRVPCYDTSRRAKNWMAVIQIDPSKPGGLDRDFCEKAHGDAYYVLPTLSPGDALEFGSDSYSSRGRKTPERAYRYVVRVEVTDGSGHIVLRKCSTGKDAVKSGAKFAAEQAAAAVA